MYKVGPQAAIDALSQSVDCEEHIVAIIAEHDVDAGAAHESVCRYRL